jgi:hypothetical protein
MPKHKKARHEIFFAKISEPRIFETTNRAGYLDEEDFLKIARDRAPKINTVGLFSPSGLAATNLCLRPSRSLASHCGHFLFGFGW